MLYNPPIFRVEDVAALHAQMAMTGLATLVTVGPDGPIASHLPLLLVQDAPDTGGMARLIGHFARGNTHWQSIDPAMPALAIFMGPDAYVSPSWYPSKAEHGRVVPTWNYAVVHARGTLRLIHDKTELRSIVDRLTDHHEAFRPKPWKVSDAPDRFVESQLAAIVGFELLVSSLEGKYKLSQNREPADVACVVSGLRREDESGSSAVAEMMSPKPR